MTEFELLAMLDKPHEGFRYPTLDEYQRAIDEIHARENSLGANGATRPLSFGRYSDGDLVYGDPQSQQKPMLGGGAVVCCFCQAPIYTDETYLSSMASGKLAHESCLQKALNTEARK